jgi:uncharacterized NAD(P)/FAD-binding protein YdhS
MQRGHHESSGDGHPILRRLFDGGLARVDPLGMGLEVASDCAIVDRFDMASERLFTIGPLTRATFWEITAIPDIRVQCAELAARMAGRGSLAKGTGNAVAFSDLTPPRGLTSPYPI